MTRPLIIDSFAGGGGASTGIEMALGRSPDIAINHNPAALALHAANHPQTLHLSENIYRVDPLDHVKGWHVGLAWFSPDCKHFSKAKGGKPVERNIRDLAWVIVLWAERAKPDVIIMENVEEWKDWGPLIETERGLMPCPHRKGETFRKWCRAMRSHGYRLDHREIMACDFGAPTIRKRLFLIARRDGKKIVWPKPTHGAPNDPDVIAGRRLPWRTAAECIDWTLPCPSIFDTAEEIRERYGLKAIRPLAHNTMVRVARGMKRYVLDAERPFLISVAHGDSGGRREYPLDDPYGVVTAGGVRHATSALSIQRFNGGATWSGIDEPMPTVTADGFIKRPGGPAPLALFAPHLSYAQQGGGSRAVDEPHHTITASSKDQNQVAAVYLAQHNNDSRRIGGVNPGRAADKPISTVTATGAQQGVVSAFVARQFGTATGHGVDEPMRTALAGSNKSQLVTPFLQAYYGNGEGAAISEPMRTVTVKDRHGLVETAISAPPFTAAQEGRARQVADFLRCHGFWDKREFVTLEIGGAVYVIVDVGMRMLRARELYNAQGFPPDYEIERGLDGNVFPQTVQISSVGNSVSPPVAAAIVGANCADLVDWREAAE